MISEKIPLRIGENSLQTFEMGAKQYSQIIFCIKKVCRFNIIFEIVLNCIEYYSYLENQMKSVSGPDSIDGRESCALWETGERVILMGSFLTGVTGYLVGPVYFRDSPMPLAGLASFVSLAISSRILLGAFSFGIIATICGKWAF